MKAFEGRFDGKDNAGLRKAIRDLVANRGERSAANAVLGLRNTVALSAAGERLLLQVAEDYRAVATR